MLYKQYFLYFLRIENKATSYVLSNRALTFDYHCRTMSIFSGFYCIPQVFSNFVKVLLRYLLFRETQKTLLSKIEQRFLGSFFVSERSAGGPWFESPSGLEVFFAQKILKSPQNVLKTSSKRPQNVSAQNLLQIFFSDLQ